MKKDQTIKCDVKSCKYNDEPECLCTLNKVDISCTCEKCDCRDKDETICRSFKEKKE